MHARGETRYDCGCTDDLIVLCPLFSIRYTIYDVIIPSFELFLTPSFRVDVVNRLFSRIQPFEYQADSDTFLIEEHHTYVARSSKYRFYLHYLIFYGSESEYVTSIKRVFSIHFHSKSFD